ncbi:hypothetical protein HPP92_027274 [Vanilla planifolia]|uniref:Uncharacterized protein n=1 Tax=Vanilla planifolia TaxID=51239 RepID=A0A835PCS8_VANPL|nr:hypothetical protein HPP92_027274 [Vanilla planifolia]
MVADEPSRRLFGKKESVRRGNNWEKVVLYSKMGRLLERCRRRAAIQAEERFYRSCCSD